MTKYLIIESVAYEGDWHFKFEGDLAAVQKLVNDLNESSLGGAIYNFFILESWYENLDDSLEELKKNKYWHENLKRYSEENKSQID